MAKVKDNTQAPSWSNLYGEEVSSLRLAEEVSYRAEQRLRQSTLFLKEAEYRFAVLMDEATEAYDAIEDFCRELPYPEAERARAASDAVRKVYMRRKEEAETLQTVARRASEKVAEIQQTSNGVADVVSNASAGNEAPTTTDTEETSLGHGDAAVVMRTDTRWCEAIGVRNRIR